MSCGTYLRPCTVTTATPGRISKKYQSGLQGPDDAAKKRAHPAAVAHAARVARAQQLGASWFGFKLFPDLTPGRAFMWGTIVAVYAVGMSAVVTARALDIGSVRIVLLYIHVLCFSSVPACSTPGILVCGCIVPAMPFSHGHVFLYLCPVRETQLQVRNRSVQHFWMEVEYVSYVGVVCVHLLGWNSEVLQHSSICHCTLCANTQY